MTKLQVRRLAVSLGCRLARPGRTSRRARHLERAGERGEAVVNQGGGAGGGPAGHRARRVGHPAGDPELGGPSTATPPRPGAETPGDDRRASEGEVPVLSSRATGHGQVCEPGHGAHPGQPAGGAAPGGTVSENAGVTDNAAQDAPTDDTPRVEVLDLGAGRRPARGPDVAGRAAGQGHADRHDDRAAARGGPQRPARRGRARPAGGGPRAVDPRARGRPVPELVAELHRLTLPFVDASRRPTRRSGSRTPSSWAGSRGCSTASRPRWSRSGWRPRPAGRDAPRAARRAAGSRAHPGPGRPGRRRAGDGRRRPVSTSEPRPLTLATTSRAGTARAGRRRRSPAATAA